MNQEQFLIYQLQQQGLAVAPDKVQHSPTWKYLGWQISDSIIRPQKLTICNKIATLNDIQKLMGDLQWLRLIVRISNEQLEVLRPLLKGTDPAAPVQLS